MIQEYYELLGVTEDATDEEIRARYEELKKKYGEERWLDGEAGNDAAKMLNKLDAAYAEILSARMERARTTEGTEAYEEISTLLKEDKINEAQAKLDEFNERSAEWHYLQAVVFYKKNWTNESKKQLEIAIQLDPENKKYRASYGKLNEKNEYKKQVADAEQRRSAYENAPDGEQMGGNTCSNCISCCYTYLCVDCLFSLCCGCR